MPARLVVVADPKLLPALAAGLREGGKFDVVPVALADASAAQAAAASADAIAVFYGAPGAPLATTLQALAPKVRDRAGRVVAVLQREQAGQREECFRSGASDVLFMPLPKDQFVARLSASVFLTFAADAGTPSTVTIATRSASSRFDNATVSSSGVEAPAQLPVKNGDTVRLSWETFQSWGLVVRAGPKAQIRFAGLMADEEGRIREWLKSARPSQPAQVAPAVSGRIAPAAGPPPGLSERKPPAPARPAPAKATAGNGAGDLSTLFEGDAAAAPPPAPQRPAAPPPPKGPPWPVPVALAVCKEAATNLLARGDPGPAIPVNVAASARKITALLSLGEQASIQKAGPESHFIDALAARVALEVATAEGTRLASANIAPAVDGDALAALTKVVDEAASRLQKEANAAIGKGEVENLQLITAASAALSRDLLNLKETADRLRGVGTAPRLGAGALDPEIVLPGQKPRPRPSVVQQSQPIKAELRDFQGLEHKPARGKQVLAVLLLLGSISFGAYAFYFGVPHHSSVAAESAGPGVQRIDVDGEGALVTVTPQWLAASEANVPKLVQVLRGHEVKKAILRLPNGNAAGIVDVATGKTSGMPRVAAQ